MFIMLLDCDSYISHGKIKFGLCLQDFKNLLLQNYSNNPLVSVIKVCSNDGATNIVHFQRNKSHRFEHSKFNAKFENLLHQS